MSTRGAPCEYSLRQVSGDALDALQQDIETIILGATADLEIDFDPDRDDHGRRVVNVNIMGLYEEPGWFRAVLARLRTFIIETAHDDQEWLDKLAEQYLEPPEPTRRSHDQD